MPSEEVRLALRKAVLPIVTTHEDGSVSCIGTGFLIGIAGRAALMLTANHNIAAIKGVDRPHPRHHASAFFVVEEDVIVFQKTKPHVIYCLDSAIGCSALLETSVGLPEVDVSACQIILGADVPPDVKFDLRLALDTRPVVPGERILAVGYSTMQSQTASVTGNRSSQNFTAQFRTLEGIVTTADGGRSEGGVPCFGVNVCLEPGMSGGPILTEDLNGNCFVRGIIRSDFDLGSDFSVSGLGLATSVWPSVILPLNSPTGERLFDFSATILDLIREGKVCDAGQIHERLRVVYDAQNSRVEAHWL
jgi:hypothetical protein